MGIDHKGDRRRVTALELEIACLVPSRDSAGKRTLHRTEQQAPVLLENRETEVLPDVGQLGREILQEVVYFGLRLQSTECNLVVEAAEGALGLAEVDHVEASHFSPGRRSAFNCIVICARPQPSIPKALATSPPTVNTSWGI